MKKSLLLTGSLILALGVVGCSNTNPNKSTQNTEQSATVTTSTDDIKNTLINQELLPLKEQTINATDSYIFEGVSDKIEEGFISQAMINVQFQDLAVIKTSDVETIKNTINDYLESDSVKSFADGYGGEENAIALSNAIVNNVGDYVYYIATTNAKDIETKLLELLK